MVCGGSDQIHRSWESAGGDHHDQAVLWEEYEGCLELKTQALVLLSDLGGLINSCWDAVEGAGICCLFLSWGPLSSCEAQGSGEKNSGQGRVLGICYLFLGTSWGMLDPPSSVACEWSWV